MIPSIFLVIAENDGFFLTEGYQERGTHYTTSNQLLSNQINALYEDNNQKHIWVAYKNTAMITRIKPFSTYYKHYQLKTQEYNNSQTFPVTRPQRKTMGILQE